MIEALLDAIQSVIDHAERPIPLHAPIFAGNEWRYLKDCLDTGWVSSVGSYVDRFERDLAAFTGIPHVVVTVNGTAALHVCLLLAGTERDDEVLIPSLTFVATSNAVAYCGAVPHFVDVDLRNLGVCPSRLEAHLAETAEVRDGVCWNRRTGRRIRALLPMHCFGHPCDLDPLADLAERYALVLIEDCAESLGSSYKGRHTGARGKAGALSFNGNKTMTTGGGGAILTTDPEWARRAKHLTTTAKCPHRWAYRHEEVGYNYRMPNLNAALGCAQLEQLPGFLQKKVELAARYKDALAAFPDVRFLEQPPNCQSNYWLNTLILPEHLADRRDALLEAAHARQILARPLWVPNHELPMYGLCPRADLSNSLQLAERAINLPSSADLV